MLALDVDCLVSVNDITRRVKRLNLVLIKKRLQNVIADTKA